MSTLPPPPSDPLTFEYSSIIDCPAKRLFEFHLDTRNASKVSPGVVGMRVTGTFPLSAGSQFTIRFFQLPLPIAIRWTFAVESVEEDRAIVDVALRSPFAYWRHEHRFDPLDAARTRLTDRVTYVPRFGRVGRVVARTLGHAALTGMFAIRHRATRRVMTEAL